MLFRLRCNCFKFIILDHLHVLGYAQAVNYELKAVLYCFFFSVDRVADRDAKRGRFHSHVPTKRVGLFGTFLYAYKAFKGVKLSTVFYLYLAIGLMFTGFFFFFKSYRFYNHFLGILFFLLANLAYTRLFYKTSDVRIKPMIPFILVAFVVSATIALLFIDFYGYYYGFGILYLLVVLNCLQAAYLRHRMVNKESFRLVFYGMLLFFVIQVLSGLDHIVLDISWLSAITVAGYFASQLMIIRGLSVEKQIRDQ